MPRVCLQMPKLTNLQDDVLRLQRQLDAEKAERIKAQLQLRRVCSRLSRALALIGVLRRREAQSRRAKDRAAEQSTRQRGHRAVSYLR